MDASVEQLEQELEDLKRAKAEFIRLDDDGVTYEEFRILQVSTLGITMGKASENIQFLERVTGRKLGGYRPMPIPARMRD
jgi:hypothetical protein